MANMTFTYGMAWSSFGLVGRTTNREAEMYQPSEFTKIIVANYSKKEADAIVVRETRRAEVVLAGEVTLWLAGGDVRPDEGKS
jgi:hypothetical protein